MDLSVSILSASREAEGSAATKPAAAGLVRTLTALYHFHLFISLSAAVFASTAPFNHTVKFSLEQIIEGDGLIAIGAFESIAAHVFWEAHFLQVLDLVLDGDLTCVVLCPLSSLAIESLEI